MNRNTIVSLAMIYALWGKEKKDLLDLIAPFALYAISISTRVGEKIDIKEVCSCMEREFGYVSVPAAVVERIISRNTPSRKSADKAKFLRENGAYYLKGSLSDVAESFSKKRTECKAHSDAVTAALADYLNKNWKHNSGEVTQSGAEALLLAFFDKQGNEVVRAVENLHQIRMKGNENEYFVANFILQEHEQKTVLMEYIVELAKGYFITEALYLQADNPNITTASFGDVTFYLDTRILLGYLGYKSEPENSSVRQVVKALQHNGAKLACFQYNVDEIHGILEAYKNASVSKTNRMSDYTLEFFDDHESSYTLVDAAQRNFEQRLRRGGIPPFSVQEVTEDLGIEGLLDESGVESEIRSLNRNYKLSTLPDDLSAITAISRIRKGKKLPQIEKCRAVFVTTNTTLVRGVRQYLSKSQLDYGFPLAITEQDLCVLALLKSFEKSNDIPRMRLLESAVAATEPSAELINVYYDNLDTLAEMGEFTSDEVALLRVDLTARKELMELTAGEKSRVNHDTLREIRKRVSKANYEAGQATERAKHRAKLEQMRNDACKRAEEEVEAEYRVYEKRGISRINTVLYIIAGAFVGAAIYMYCIQAEQKSWLPLAMVTLFGVVSGVLPLLKKDNFIVKKYRKTICRKKLVAIDERKEKYMSLIKDC